MKKILVLGLLALAVACGSTDTGEQGIAGEQGPQGPQGPAGEPGAPGADGTNGLNGEAGAPGSDGVDGKDGKDGKDGDVGPKGDQGDQGEIGPQGDIGDIACGDDLIKAAEWHSKCGTDVGECVAGQVQCRLSLQSEELIPKKVCYGEVKAASNSGKCHRDADCDGAADNTVGQGDNVTLVKQAKTLEVLISGSAVSADIVLEAGRCRNAKKHCIAPGTEGVASKDANDEGVLWSDFVADPKEGDMGFECVSGNDVRTWDCTVTNGVAAVTCTGPRAL